MNKKTVVWLIVCVAAVAIVVAALLLIPRWISASASKNEDTEVILFTPIDDKVYLACIKKSMDQDGETFASAWYYLYDGDETVPVGGISSRSFWVESDREQTDGKNRNEIPDMRSEIWEVSGRTYVVMFATPNADAPNAPAYEESIFYGLVPEDTLRTKSVKVQREDIYRGYPTWVFVVRIDKITEDYCLTYGGFHITGKQILESNSG